MVFWVRITEAYLHPFNKVWLSLIHIFVLQQKIYRPENVILKVESNIFLVLEVYWIIFFMLALHRGAFYLLVHFIILIQQHL